MNVILISGKARHGKDTVAKILSRKLQSDTHKVLVTHYADLLKFVCKNYFGWDGKKDEKGRRMLQYVGTDVVREKYPNMWVDFTAKILSCFNNQWDYVIIPDCRFPNEISALSDYGFKVTHIKVVREGFDNDLTDEQKEHPSETALDGIEPDYYINNDGTIHRLKKTVTEWAERSLYGRY